MTIFPFLIAAALATNDVAKAADIELPKTNVVRRIRKLRAKAPSKSRTDMTPIEAWHNFCKPNGKVKFQDDIRPEPYTKEKPNPHKRKPRK